MTAFFTPDRRDLRERLRREGSAADGLAARARFSRWDGSQHVPDLAAEEILDALADDVMAEGDVGEALRRLMERGWRSDDTTRPDLPGLQDLLDRLRERRREITEQHRLGDVFADVRRELDEIVSTERAGIERRLDEAARDGSDTPRSESAKSGASRESDETREPASGLPDPAEQAALRRMLRETAGRRLERLESLPRDVGARIRGLEDYDFLEPAARERFGELVERLRSTMLDRYVQGMSDALKSMTSESLTSTREMVRDLNQLLQERLAGGDPDASGFLSRWGSYFPGAETLDDVIEQLADRMAAMQSLLRSMTPDQRAELQSMMDALLRDDRLRWDLAQLAATLDQLVPGGLGERIRFSGDQQLGLEGALEQLDALQRLDGLEESLAGVESIGDLGDLDRDAVRELLGDASARDLDALDDLARRLEEAGYLTRDGDHLELTPRGTRRIGQKVLDDLFAKLRRDAFGGHRVDRAGRGGEREETSKPYEFGDSFQLDLRATLANAMAREENAPGRRTAPAVSLDPADFAVYRTEELTRTSTVLLVDMSRSMLLRGCFVAAKKVAIALNTLIRTQFPRDDLAVIGFAYYAREIHSDSLAELTWHGYEYGTNLQHGLMLARRFLARSHGGNKEIVVITDGEPTAHFEDGQVEFSYPPTRRTIQETLREVVRCTKEGITINTFMLERSRSLADFVALVTRLNRGRAFYATPERLGEYVLVDFVNRRTKHVA
ncbi:MAG TPA: hypothetical protein VFS32_07385 [Candidatus Limnocylindrales bacterium]|nr:hypothetical protein [Candidatus Limnocylindrales bacterium]